MAEMTAVRTNALSRSRGLISSEWLKFWTIRSNVVLVAVCAVWAPASASLSSSALAQRATDSYPGRRIAVVTAYTFLDSILWLQLLLAVVAVLFATSEYSNRQIRVTLLAVPARIPVPLSKAIVIGVVAFLIGVVGAGSAQALPAALLVGSKVEYDSTLGEGVALALAAGLYLAAISIVTLSIGVLVKNVVVGILISLALFTIVPAMLGSTGVAALERAVGFFPTIAGRGLISTFANPAGLSHQAGMAVLGGWAVLGLAGAALVYRFRDA